LHLQALSLLQRAASLIVPRWIGQHLFRNLIVPSNLFRTTQAINLKLIANLSGFWAGSDARFVPFGNCRFQEVEQASLGLINHFDRARIRLSQN
jgi:hypothetical protein